MTMNIPYFIKYEHVQANINNKFIENTIFVNKHKQLILSIQNAPS